VNASVPPDVVAVDRRFVRGRLRLPMNLLLTARRPT